MQISRREALHRLTVIVGGAVSAPTLSAIFSGCRAAPPSADWTPQVLNASQADLLSTVVDLVIPATDTPGAVQAGVPVFIDKLLQDWVDAEQRERVLAGLENLNTVAGEAHGVPFMDATPEQQAAILNRLDADAIRAREEEVDPLPFFATLKEWTLVGYYTSEIGATQELQWLAVPGRYDADLSIEEVGRSWA